MEKLNLVTYSIILLFSCTILSGFFRAFTRENIHRGFASILDNIEFIGCIFFAFYLTRKIFFENEKGIFKSLYDVIPVEIKNAVYSKDILTYMVAVPFILLILMIFVRLLTNYLYRLLLIPVADRIYESLNNSSSLFKRIVGTLSKLPKAIIFVIILCLLMNFYSYYFYSPVLTRMMNESGVYKLVYENTIHPVLNSKLVKEIPVIVQDSFIRDIDKLVPDSGSGKEINGRSVKDLINNLKDGKIKVIEHFNGVTLNEAIKSNSSIDDKAREIAGKESSDTKKSYLIYKWITRNIKYDFEKVKNISKDPRGISSGSIIAFETGKGICFDYSSLFVSMCRAVGLKVRLVTGLGFSGSVWGDHAWNQVYSGEEKRWINVDSTFGTTSNYFDKPGFNDDHRDAEIQGEW